MTLHPAQIAIRRANERRDARQAKPAVQNRQDLEASITAAFAAKFPAYPLYHSLIRFYGVVMQRQMTERQLREFHERINNA